MSETNAQESGHRYNDDLLLNESEHRQASQEFGRFFFALDFPELRDYFKPVEQRANAAKAQAHSWGVRSVVVSVLGLIAGAIEPLWSGLPGFWPPMIGLIAAVMSIGGAIVAYSVGTAGTRRRAWLIDRMRTERLRQLQFQILATQTKLISVCAEDLTARDRFITKRRDDWLQSLKNTLEGRHDSKFGAILGENARNEIWLVPRPTAGELQEMPNARELFTAYAKLRIRSQMDYAEHKLQEHTSASGFWGMSLVEQARLLNMLWSSALVALLVVHFIVAMKLWIPRWEEAWTGYLHMGSVVLALVALGIRTIHHGLGLDREIERYRDYKADLQEISYHFEHARNDESLVEAMLEMEKLSFEEMRNFLRAHNEASFLL